MKQDAFFNNVTNWAHTVPDLEAQNNYLMLNIIAKLPQSEHAIFANDATVRHDGFAMLDRLITRLSGNAAKHHVSAITDLSALEFTATDTLSTYMACLRGIQSALNKILCLFALNKLDTGLNPGASNLFLRGEPTLLAENLSDC
eukprot:scaffold137967_cov36-Cyclotella_meneghiniana.AAC.2